MPANPRKHQKKQEQRKAKRKLKQQQLARQKQVGLPERLKDAARFPVIDSWVTDVLWDEGLGQILIARKLPGNLTAFGFFLVDRYCLGVKDADANVVPRSVYEQRFRQTRARFPARDLSPAACRKFVEDAVAYAARLGLPPHPDYHRANLIFGDIDPSTATEELEFGKDGKPFFVAGPYDDPARCRRITAALQESCGPDGYHSVIPFARGGEILSDDSSEGPIPFGAIPIEPFDPLDE